MYKAQTFTKAALVLAVSIIFAGTSAAQRSPRVFLLDGKQLSETRLKISSDTTLRPALDKLERDAKKALKVDVLSVVTKAVVPPSGDKHDYMSQSPYFWKDPKKADGLPHIRRDGEKNPETKNFPDHEQLDALIKNVEILSLAYYYTGKEAYAAKATGLLRMWFIDAKTKMNPNLEYAQGVPGQSTGRSFGIIETRGLSRVVDSIGLLDGSKSWTSADQAGLISWFGKFLDWLTTSKNGTEESKAKNNHGTWYDVQTTSFYLFVGKTEAAKKILESAKQVRIATQIEPDGSQPLEMARTRSLSYSTINLEAFLSLARLGDTAGVDLWSFQTKDGRSIRKAIGYLYPFAAGEKKWDHQQIIDFQPDQLRSVLRLATDKYSDADFKKMMSSLPKPANVDLRNTAR